jgi:chlorite dismutase
LPVTHGWSGSDSDDRAGFSVADGPPFVHALGLMLDPGWRRQALEERCRCARCFVDAVRAPGPVRTHAYSTVGLRGGVDVLLWSLGPSPERLEERAAAALRTGLGAWASVRQSLLGVVAGSPYARRSPPRASALFAGTRARYLVVYPFTKSTDWHLLRPERRQGIMDEHVQVARRYPQVRQLLANGFGLGDQDYVVAYETDDLETFSHLVHALRSTEGRLATVRDTPVLTGVHRPPADLVRLLTT